MAKHKKVWEARRMELVRTLEKRSKGDGLVKGLKPKSCVKKLWPPDTVVLKPISEFYILAFEG